MNSDLPQKSALFDSRPNTPKINAMAIADEDAQAEPLPVSIDQTPQQMIERAVFDLLDEDRSGEEKRWNPRVLFVRPVSVRFKHWRWATRQELAELDFQESVFSEFRTEIAAFSTDISPGGIRIVAMVNALPTRVTLEVSGTVFACEVRWSESIDAIHFRYGLQFVDVLDKSARQD